VLRTAGLHGLHKCKSFATFLHKFNNPTGLRGLRSVQVRRRPPGLPLHRQSMASQPNSYKQVTYEALPIVPRGTLWLFVSRLEQIVAGLSLILSFPILMSVCLITWMLSGRSPLVAHRRVGKDGRPMWVYKVRTMWGPRKSRRLRFRMVEYLRGSVVPECKCRFDPRITSRFAVFCRKYSVDELPQLWLVACGEMSMVGPRPMTEPELITHYGSDTWRILQVKPGLTGLWQIRGRNNLNYRQRRRLDMFMLDKWSFALYAAILFASVPKVLTGKNAW
jgi:exopolysaccharide production protein ExoY